MKPAKLIPATLLALVLLVATACDYGGEATPIPTLAKHNCWPVEPPAF